MKNELQSLVRAHVKALDYTRNRNVLKFGHSVMERTYSRSDAQASYVSSCRYAAWIKDAVAHSRRVCSWKNQL